MTAAAAAAHRSGSPQSRRSPYAGAGAFLPQRRSLGSLSRAAAGCRGCDLYRHASQTVFGEGPASARLMLVGEQPGNEEDLGGKPFIGPAGRVLDQALLAAGLQRDEVYVSNVVKHFKWLLRGKRRLHQKPWIRQIEACLPWLQQELALVQPQVLVCLGATAAQALLGRGFKVLTQRGVPLTSEWAPQVVATIHPSSLLRMRDAADRRAGMDRFVADLKVAARLLG